MLKSTNLQKKYTTDEVQTTALDGINFLVQAVEFVAIMGSSGGGKSTLLNINGLLDNVLGGEFWFLDREISCYSETQRAN